MFASSRSDSAGVHSSSALSIRDKSSGLDRAQSVQEQDRHQRQDATASLRVRPQPVSTESVPAQKNFISHEGRVSASGTQGVTGRQGPAGSTSRGEYEKHPLTCLTTPPATTARKSILAAQGGNPCYRNPPFSQKFILQIGKCCEAHKRIVRFLIEC